MQKGRDGRATTTAGVAIERDDRHCVVYRGTRASLIAAGLVAASSFPQGNKRLAWHYSRSGVNWSIRLRSGGVYCLTKLKDKRGAVDAEIAAFKAAASADARRDAGFQRFLSGLRGSDLPALAPPPTSRATQKPNYSPTYGPVASAVERFTAERAPGQPAGLERLAIATLVVGITLYFWMRQT